MQIWHRIAVRGAADTMRRLDDIGITYELTPTLTPADPMISFEIDESDHRWPKVDRFISTTPLPVSNTWETHFSDGELLKAKWVRLIPSFRLGFPQPQETWAQDPANYADHCPECGIYLQEASYRLMSEPILGVNDFMSMHWIHDLFCTSAVISALDRLDFSGYEVWDAIIHNSGKPSQVVSQLFVPGVASAGLLCEGDLPSEHCSTCNVTKYNPHSRGVMYMQRTSLPDDRDVALSCEWYGSAHMAYREILASQRVARLILERGWKGVRMKVVELV